MARIHGRNGVVYLGSGGNAAVQLSQAAEYSIDYDKDLVDVPVLGDQWVTKVAGMFKWSGSVNGTYDTGQNLAWDAAIGSSTSQAMYVYPDKTQPTRYYYGFVWPKLSVKGGVGAEVTFAMSFEGDGALAKN